MKDKDLAQGDGWRLYDMDGTVWMELRGEGQYWTCSRSSGLVILKPEVIEAIKSIKQEARKL